ncbi:GTPase obg [Mycoplasma haemofelis str. Langford 1]|uniref:GTPase Obg n=1 Tax=Mycoplasma haemofelis (strain Langford 1) TaxID=941640 RepID=E8ZJW1_MYCHL|nr:GTPase ObgE [Mycoplasma haemofelis]CBY93432.1 GTPase obg [Mycoplasma haemofelis str. Langford 1]
MKFISSTSITLKSGKGGDGIIAWRRESKVRLGGPAGGNGGKGGSVYIEADENVNSLFHLRHLKVLKAQDGENGRNKSQHGRGGEDLYLKVPCGTNVFNRANNEKLFELISHQERFLACKGGEGGRGNASFKSPKNSAPYLYELGDPAEELEVILDLETISDIGFLGKPNAGKSSLLSLISNAKPKIASFPFTTLIPVLGTVVHEDKKLVFADIPGLIENASQGAGLGFEFLKHLNRCRVLVHLVDCSEEDVENEILSIENEIKAYSEELFNKPRFICLNKIDLISDESLECILKKVELLGRQVIPVSVLKNKNIDVLLGHIFKFYESCSFITPQKPDYLEISDDPDLFASILISREDNFWNVEHPSLRYWVRKIPLDTYDNIARLLQKISSLGVEKELIKAGAVAGDDVRIYDFHYKFQAT